LRGGRGPKLLVVYHQSLEKLPESDLVEQIQKEYSGEWVSARDLGVVLGHFHELLGAAFVQND